MLDDFLVRAGLAAAGVAVAAGPLGCFVVWRRMAFFGDATAHSALLGVALGLAFDMPILAGVLMISVAMAFGVAYAARGDRIAIDTLLGVFSHAALALGVVAISLTPSLRLDLESYLFGDLLAVSRTELAWIYVGAFAVLGLLAMNWRSMLNATLSAPLSVAEGGAPERDRLGLLLALAVTVAVAMQVVGLLLVTALLVLPAATARPFARTPEAMALIAVCIGLAGAAGGLQLSIALDTPSGPTIVVGLFALFCVSGVASAVAARIAGRGDPG